jgi:hypothetical protein
MAVHGELGDAGGRGDLVHAGAVESLLGEHPLGRLEDRGALAEILGPARGVGAGVLLAGGGG